MKTYYALPFMLWLAVISPMAQAGEGHGHGEAPATAAGPALPTVTAVSESFELVGRLTHDELSILVDRTASNEPVLEGNLKVEINGRSAEVKFHAEHGDYSLSDAAILEMLKKPGVKSMTFTLVIGKESDLLTGELDVHDEAIVGHRHGWLEYVSWAAAALAVLFILFLGVRALRMRRQSRTGGVA